jgi:hypothetical protein
MEGWSRLADDIQRAYQEEIVDPGKQPLGFLLLAFLLTFVLVRFITHSIRAGRFHKVFHNVSAGGTHLHHLVPGILLVLACGVLGFGLPPGVAREPLAIGFGIGMALTLDEFALWLHLEDVYWAKEGRQSVDAVIVTATLLALGILGVGFWVELAHAIVRAF